MNDIYTVWGPDHLCWSRTQPRSYVHGHIICEIRLALIFMLCFASIMVLTAVDLMYFMKPRGACCFICLVGALASGQQMSATLHVLSCCLCSSFALTWARCYFSGLLNPDCPLRAHSPLFKWALLHIVVEACLSHNVCMQFPCVRF